MKAIANQSGTRIHTPFMMLKQIEERSTDDNKG